jgi:hypothetical protein
VGCAPGRPGPMKKQISGRLRTEPDRGSGADEASAPPTKSAPRMRAAALLDRLVGHVIHDDHWNGSLLLHKLQSEFAFNCVESRDTVGIRGLRGPLQATRSDWGAA